MSERDYKAELKELEKEARELDSIGWFTEKAEKEMTERAHKIVADYLKNK